MGSRSGAQVRAKHVVFLLAALGTLAFVLVRPPAPLAATTPSLVGTTSNSTSLSGVPAVAIAGNYAYGTAYYAGTLTAVDISDRATRPSSVRARPRTTSRAARR